MDEPSLLYYQHSPRRVLEKKDEYEDNGESIVLAGVDPVPVFEYSVSLRKAQWHWDKADIPRYREGIARKYLPDN